MPPKMAQPSSSIDGTLRFLSIVHGILLFSMFMYVFVQEKILVHHTRAMDRTLLTGFAVQGISIIAIAAFLRFKLVSTAMDALRSTPADGNSLAKWRRGALVCDILAESVVLLGFALRALGATIQQAAPYYAAGVLLMILWWPRRP